jgi:hypothetical protein
MLWPVNDNGSAQEFWERLASSAQTAAGRLRVKSALNPMLWLCGIISLPCLFGAYAAHGNEPIATILAICGATPIGVTCLLAGYFAAFRPDKLQSEDYQIRHEALELIKEKGSQLEIAQSSLEVIANPPLLPSPGNER